MKNEFAEISVKDAERITREQLIKIGKKLKEIRIKHNLTLNDVSFFTYINLDSIHRLERGKLKNTTLLTLSKFTIFYKISWEELVS